MNINTGGPAFPRSESLYPDGSVSDPGAQGLSIRDYFAAKAMQGLLAQSNGTAFSSPSNLAAEYAYRMADAMLKAREAGE